MLIREKVRVAAISQRGIGGLAAFNRPAEVIHQRFAHQIFREVAPCLTAVVGTDTGQDTEPGFIAVGGVAVCPGDLIVGDADGVIVIPLGDAEAVLNKAKEYAKFDASKVEAAKNGTANRLWVKKSLDETGVEFIDDMYR